MNLGWQLFKNTFFLTLGQAISKGIGFCYILLLVRYLSVEDFGKYSLVISLIVLFEQLSRCGIDRLIIREVARDPSRTQIYLGNVLPLRVLFAALSYCALALFVWVMGYGSALFFIAGLVLFSSSCSSTLDAIFHGRQQMALSSLGIMILSLASAGFGLLAIHLKLNLTGIIGSFVLADLVYLVATVCFARAGGIPIGSRQNKLSWRQILRSSFPYALIGFIGSVYLRSNIILLGWIKGNDSVALYSVAYRLPETSFYVSSTIAMAALTPTFARLHVKSIAQMREVYISCLKISSAVAIPLVILAFAYADWLITLLFTAKYAEAVSVFRILLLSGLFYAMFFANAALMLSSNLLGEVVRISALAVVANISINLSLIPLYGTYGSAISTVLSDALWYVASFMFIKRRFLTNLISSLRRALLPPLIAGAGMMIMLLILKGAAPLVGILVSFLAYAAVYSLIEFWALEIRLAGKMVEKLNGILKRG